ncbi:hypothetical protein SAMN05216241_10948 [Limimonas halophila]|uniref:Uncharacterized protein n=1 Tax=Limimonas halophila TaxID=1082479 RepID=A0A1G7TEL5_9PROT|nr:hypothetical protein [Limimonas halophila]SDG33631.1 hypothetical protein SAMN05216241_10948 [Limimonas halophila]
MTDIKQRDLSRKRDEDLTSEERQELQRRFEEFAQMVRENGAERMGIQGRPTSQKKVKKWDPTSMAKQMGGKKRSQ